MALDTKYRPLRFEDVLGQEGTVKVLRQFVKQGSGFHQSYLFCGSHGSGKTSLGRILARALLCENPQDGNPCDMCSSCKSILDRGSNECFVEVDAATNSGKDDIRKIVEMLQFDTFSGRRRIFLFDEAHRLSKDALDALLKPMEDTIHGGEDKLLVCIFCTTEPERMRSTIFSRCAPAFVIRPVSPEGIAVRLAHICDLEHITYEKEALVCIAEATECHIRDAMKSVEGVSMLGTVSLENVKSYLRLNANSHYLKLLAYMGRDLSVVLTEAQALHDMVSPSTVYDRLSELAMMAYRVGIGVGKAPSYWNAKLVQSLWVLHQGFLLQVAQVMSAKPGHPTFAMLECDLSSLHFLRQGGISAPPPSSVVIQTKVETVSPKVLAPVEEQRTVVVDTIRVAENSPAPAEQSGTVEQAAKPTTFDSPILTRGGVYIDPRGINRKKDSVTKTFNGTIPPMEPVEFKRLLRRMVMELATDERRNRSAR